MKKGYKHKTGIFGDDAEAYLSQLYLMMKHPKGHRRPDLVTINGRYTPKLSLEVKSGAKQKGVLVDYQLHYSITSEQDYEDLFGERLPRPNDFLTGIDWSQYSLLPKRESVAYYYSVISRIDGLTSADLDGPFSNVKIKWGDQYIAPGDYAFHMFAIARHKRTGEALNQITSDLHSYMKSCIIDQHSHYDSRRSDKNSWQDIHGRDFLALFTGDDSIATASGRERIDLLRKWYPQVNDLERIKLRGTGPHHIYALVEPRHRQLFNVQLRAVVTERRPLLEQVVRERAIVEPFLPLIRRTTTPYLLELLEDEDEGSERLLDRFNLDFETLLTIRRVSQWRPEHDTQLTDDIPF